MKRVRKVIITGRRKVGSAMIVAKKVMKKLKEWKVQYEVTDYFPAQQGGANINNIKADMVLCFGGDGSFLRTFQRLNKSIPVLGINCGNRGFLLGLDDKNVLKKLPKILKGEYVIETRTRIKVFIDGKFASYGLNEVTIVPQLGGRLLKYSLKVDDTDIGFEADDGLIVSTPTGSTGHAISAGGPQITYNAKVFVIVRMNPIDLNRRPLVVNDTSTILIEKVEKTPLQVIIDGQQDFLAEKQIKIVKGKSVLLVKPK